MFKEIMEAVFDPLVKVYGHSTTVKKKIKPAHIQDMLKRTADEKRLRKNLKRLEHWQGVR